MKPDDLIDDVARQMTAVNERPALRARVMAGIDAARGSTSRPWLIPVVAASAVVAVALAWVLALGVTEDHAVPVQVARQDLVLAPQDGERDANVETPAPPAPAVMPDVPRVARAVPRRGIEPTPAAVTTGDGTLADVWIDTMDDVPPLPPLQEPEPIVIEAIAFDEVTIVPIAIVPIEMKALVIEPLRVAWPDDPELGTPAATGL